MTVLVLGSGGQLGTALQSTKPDGINLVARDVPALDLTDVASVEKTISEIAPTLILNAAAYTAVDKAEAEENLAFQVNAKGVEAVARAAERIGARLIHVSTDYVFDGTKGLAYGPSDATTPLGVYGRSKLEGEKRALSACSDCLVVRTAWLYGDQGANFVRTMLRLMANHSQVRVVADQVGTPTYATAFADALWALAATERRGILHYTDSGVASWYDFACAIQEEALSLGLLKDAVPVLPITTADYPTPARRPSFGILDKSETWSLLGKPARHWRENLRDMLGRIKNA